MNSTIINETKNDNAPNPAAVAKEKSLPVNPNKPSPPAEPVVPDKPADPIVIAIDHGYGNIKTPTFIFPACVTPCHGDMLLSTDDVLTYEGKRYAIGTGHKEFRQDKIMDEDYYILTLAAIGKELLHRGLTSAKIVIAGGLPLTWADRQREQFKAYEESLAALDDLFMGEDFPSLKELKDQKAALVEKRDHMQAEFRPLASEMRDMKVVWKNVCCILSRNPDLDRREQRARARLIRRHPQSL